MLFVDNEGHHRPQTNLAIEEFLLRHEQFDEPILLFYINEPSVIIGRNQNTLQEIDQTYVEENGIHLVRRLSGGGAVYHDLGNLNYSFITNGRQNLHNFSAFLEPVIQTLNEMGIPAEMGGNSDIVMSGKKLSGNAQYATPRRMFSHGTLLFDTDIEPMLKSLNPRQIKIESKAVQSVRSAVANIKALLPEEMDIEQFKQRILHGVFPSDDVPQYRLTETDWEKIRQIESNRYDNWSWNVGRSPRYNVQHSTQLPYGLVDARIDVAQGEIQNLKLYGNFFGANPAVVLEEKLQGVRYERPSLNAALAGLDVGQYIVGLSTDAFIELLLGENEQ